MRTDATCLPSSHSLDRSVSTPLSVQLKNIIREKIRTGEWEPDSMIPSENKLSEMYGISRMTARNVISLFVAQGYLYRVQGKGTFVSGEKLEISTLTYSGLRKQLEEKGHHISTQLLSCKIIEANDFVAGKLNLIPGAPVYEIKRVRSADGRPISYHKSFIPQELCPGLHEKDLQGEQLCTILSNDYLLAHGRVVETIESFISDKTKSGYLKVKQGFPLILLQDQLFTADDTAFEFSCVYFRGDKISLRTEYRE